MFISVKEQKFFCDWYFRAQLDENYDSDRQFFYFYALFNHLFQIYCEEHEKMIKNQGLKLENGERSKIMFFLYNIFFVESIKSNFETYNPFATLKSGQLTLLIDKFHIESNDEVLTTFRLPPFEILSKLFMEIYKLRCDLFHGSADLSDCNNYKLIDEANVVLKGFLERLFDTNLSENK